MVLHLILIFFIVVVVVTRLLDYISRKSPRLKQRLSTCATSLRVVNTLITLAIVWCLCLYPCLSCLKVIFNPTLRRGEIPNFVVNHFRKTSSRFEKWATRFIESQRATEVSVDNAAATEWPIFGSVYYLLAAEEIHHFLEEHNGPGVDETEVILQKAARAAAAIVADPKTGSWVRDKWGPSYLTKENVFYRMLLIMGLSSYENISGDTQYRQLLESQATSLGAELTRADTHLRDDYPGECYPNDVLWAVAAILRADRILGTDHSELRTGLLRTLDTVSLTPEMVPAYGVAAPTGQPLTVARGCANSGILVFAPELDIEIAKKWYAYHEKYFWQENWFVKGFREYTRDFPDPMKDVDTGPIIAGFGTVASVFGIGAARGVGRLDHAVPLTMETIVLSWPTPFGLMLPSLMAHLGAKAAPLGDITILFLMTRPIVEKDITRFSGPVPGIVWITCLFYLGAAIFSIWSEYRRWRKFLHKKQDSS